MITRSFILATAGHVDHGKSALVKALTGIDPDRLPEEKARGITIDLGFAHLEVPGNIGPQPARFQLGIIDVPGHADFVKNMVAGIGSIDLALLIVAADDGWMPQTEEHAQILSYLGVTRAIVALTKIDLAEDEETLRHEVRAKLDGSPFADAPIIATSTVSGRGLDELKRVLATLLENAPPTEDIGKPRLPVDRAFMLRGIGTVVTGTLTGGELHRGQAVVLQPRGAPARVRSVQNYNREVEIARPSTRTALNLVDVKSAAGESGIQRGDVVTLSALGDASKIADVVIERSARLAKLKTPAGRPLKDGVRIRIHLGSGDVAARIILSGKGSLEAGERRLAQLRFETPVFAFAGDRFIVRDWPEQATLAGGIVLDPDPPRKRLDLRRHLLDACAQAPSDASVFALSALRRCRAERSATLLVKSRFSAREIAEALSRLQTAKQVLLDSGWAMDAAWWDQMRKSAAASIDASHRAHPDRPGLPIPELKAAIEKDLPATELFDLLVRGLAQNGFTHAGIFIKRAAHQLSLPPELNEARAQVRQALSAKPFDPPSRKEAAPDAPRQQALRFLIQSGEAIALAQDVVLLTESFRQATERVQEFLRTRGSGTASEIRQALGTSRRVVIPLLEQLDKNGVTRREGDKRVLRQ